MGEWGSYAFMRPFNKPFYAAIGKRVKKARLSLDLTREKLALLASISDKFLYDIEVGNKGMSAEAFGERLEEFFLTVANTEAYKLEHMQGATAKKINVQKRLRVLSDFVFNDKQK